MIEKLLVVGAGGHAKSVMDMVMQNEDYEIAGCIDLAYPTRRTVEGMEQIPLIGTDADLPKFLEQGIRKIFIALGNNRLRHRIFLKVVEFGFEPVNVISSHAILSKTVRLGRGICIMPGAVVNVNTWIGDNCIINTNCSIDHDCVIQQSAHIAPGVTLSGRVTIGELTQLGTGACVIDGISIGACTMIGAGSVVVRDIGPGVVAYGVPARIVKE